ncbi:hypothetical protein D9M69_732000 [compost metagenome]
MNLALPFSANAAEAMCHMEPWPALPICTLESGLRACARKSSMLAYGASLRTTITAGSAFSLAIGRSACWSNLARPR